MLNKMAIATALLLALSVSLPLNANSSWTYTGRITARTATSFSVFEKEHVKLAIDDRTTVTPWIREKPFVRTATYLTTGALKFGALVRVRTRDGRVADRVEVANDVKTTFSGPVVAYDDTWLSVYDEDMDVVTLRIGEATVLTQLFTVKPWVRTAVHLTPADLKVGARVIMYLSEDNATMADRVEIATDEPVSIPPRTKTEY